MVNVSYYVYTYIYTILRIGGIPSSVRPLTYVSMGAIPLTTHDLPYPISWDIHMGYDNMIRFVSYDVMHIILAQK